MKSHDSAVELLQDIHRHGDFECYTIDNKWYISFRFHGSPSYGGYDIELIYDLRSMVEAQTSIYRMLDDLLDEINGYICNVVEGLL